MNASADESTDLEVAFRDSHVGDVLDEGPTLKDIVAEGAVLEFHGVTFLLPAY